MIALALFLASLTHPLAARHCEEYRPRLDGTRVTVCDGKVVRVRDKLSNSRAFERDGTIVIRSPGGPARTLSR